jgi:hypothetical protein
MEILRYAQNDGLAGGFRQHLDVQAKDLNLLGLAPLAVTPG